MSEETLNTNEEVVNNDIQENTPGAEAPVEPSTDNVEAPAEGGEGSETPADEGGEEGEGADDEDDRPVADTPEEAADDSSETPRETYYAGYLVLKEEPVNINGVERVKLRVRDTHGQEQDMIVLPEEYEGDKNIK